MSFFGFDTSKPTNAKKEVDYDELLEEKYKHAGEGDLGQLEPDDEDLNDETFGGAVDVSSEFNFGSTEPLKDRSQHFRNQQPVVPPTMTSQGSGLIVNGPAVHQGLGMGSIHNQIANLHLNSQQVPGVPMNYRPQPMQYPQTVMLNGIPVVPIEMPPTAKNAVYGMMQQIKPLFQHIDTLMKALYEKRGEAERPNLQILSSMKQTILLQMAGLENGIFILRPEDAAHLQSSMVNIFSYAERILLPQNPAASKKQESGQPQPTHGRASSTTGAKLSGMSNIDQLDSIPSKSDSSQGATKIKLKEPVSSTKSRDISLSPSAKRIAAIKEPVKQTINPKDDFVPIDEAAFPALGTAIEQIKPKSRSASKDSSSGFVIKRLERKGNQKQRRDESRTESPNQNGQGEKVWTLQKDGVAIPVESTQIGRAEKYKGVMLKHERELIAKLQISQLVTDKPFVDDYYFQMYKRTKENVDPVLKLKGRQSRKWKFSAHQLLAGKEAVSNDRQNDLKRLIESRRTNARRASSTLSLEGALGSISRTTNKAPRQAISIVASNSDQSFTQSSRLTELAYIEKFYDVVLRLEELFRKKIPEKQEEIDIHEEKINKTKLNLWQMLTIANEEFDKKPNPLITSLRFKKGLNIICRALALVEQKQCLGFFSLLLNRLECLEVCNISLGEKNQTVDYFLETLYPILSEVVSESSLSVISALVQIILERHNLLWVAKSRIGLELLTLFLSKAELLKSAENVNEKELQAWGEVFDFIFKSYESQFTDLFAKNIEPADEEYIWQFLSALAVGASGIEQQKILVSELRFIHFNRNNIISTSKLDHPRALENVNLFLKALGLNIDAKQLAAMSK